MPWVLCAYLNPWFDLHCSSRLSTIIGDMRAPGAQTLLGSRARLPAVLRVIVPLDGWSTHHSKGCIPKTSQPHSFTICFPTPKTFLRFFLHCHIWLTTWQHVNGIEKTRKQIENDHNLIFAYCMLPEHPPHSRGMWLLPEILALKELDYRPSADHLS